VGLKWVLCVYGHFATAFVFSGWGRLETIEFELLHMVAEGQITNGNSI